MSSSTPPSLRDFAQQLKDHVPIDTVIGEYVPSMVRAGNSFKACCPFHKEKTPSFHVNPEHGFYHCFGCQAHGDVIKFVQEIEKTDFMAALEILARRAGLAVPRFSPGEDRTPDEEKRLQQLRELCAWAEGFFIRQLREHPRGSRAREYLIGRGLTDAQIDQYRLGFAPDGYEVLLREAERKGWKADTVAEAGLASRKDNGSFIDRFRDRVIFPIADKNGQVVAFAGRILEKLEDVAKYINSAETPLFKKKPPPLWRQRRARGDQDRGPGDPAGRLHGLDRHAPARDPERAGRDGDRADRGTGPSCPAHDQKCHSALRWRRTRPEGDGPLHRAFIAPWGWRFARRRCPPNTTPIPSWTPRVSRRCATFCRNLPMPWIIFLRKSP